MSFIASKIREYIDLSIVVFFAIAFTVFIAFVNIFDRFTYLLRMYKIQPATGYIITFASLTLCILLFITYRRWKYADARQKELSDIIGSISQDVLLVLDSSGTITMCSGSIKRMFGYEPDEIIHRKGDFLYRYIAPESEHWNDVFKTLEKDGFNVGRGEGKRKNDKQIPIEIVTGLLNIGYGAVVLLRDISEHIRAEQEIRRHRDRLEELVETRTAALRESEERFRNLANLLPETVFETDTDGMLTFVNRIAFQKFGYSREDFSSGLECYYIIAPEERKQARQNAESIMNGEELGASEYTIVRKDGTEFPAILHSSPIIRDGKCIGLRGMIVDITKHKQIEEEIKRYQLMVQSAQDAIFLKNLDSRYIEANDRTFSAFGLSRDEVIGKRDDEIMADINEAKKNISNDKRVFDTGESLEITKHMTSADGREIWFHAIKVPYLDENGNITGLVGVAREVTKLIEVERALRESEEKYRNLVERANDGIVIIQDGIIKHVNPHLADMWGGTIDELIGNSFKDYIHPDEIENIVERYKLRMLGGKPSPVYETILLRKDGSEVNTEISSGIITYRGKPADMAIIRNITQRKQMERELKTEMDKLQVFHKLMVGRELRMIELKNEINSLLKKMGLTEKYDTLINEDLDIDGNCNE